MSNLEGTDLDIAGSVKPRVYGKVRNVSPVLVNPARQIYQVADQSAVSVVGVYDRGVVITAGSAYANLLQLRSTAPSAGQYRAFQGYFRLGAAPSGQVTCDADNAVSLLGAVAQQLAGEVGRTANAADVAAANAAGDIGIYLDEPTPTQDLFDLLAASLGGYHASGVNEIRLRPLVAPASPVLTLEDYEIGSINRTATAAGGNGLRIWRVVVRGDRIGTVQKDAVGAANAARLTSEYREASWESAAVKTRHPLAEELVVETALRTLAACQALADRLGPLLSVRRDSVIVTALFSPQRVAAISAVLSIGTTLTLRTPRLGYDAGRDVVVTGFEIDGQRGRATLNLWG